MKSLDNKAYKKQINIKLELTSVAKSPKLLVAFK
jgi:hypothetical protein